MKASILAIGLALSLVGAGGAVASTWHWAQASTKEDAMTAATAEAQAKARRKGTCYKPAATLDVCRQTAEGFSCRADSADVANTCVAWDEWVPTPARAARRTTPMSPFSDLWSRAQPFYSSPTYVGYPYAPGVYVPPPLTSQ
ncbi:hypothetical protein [Caulobacter hibisci]|uniref:DUF3551 domain-containing protein n=1 Tax=Caulobacter hibisci TaxID=2035993 RepID=A0ABS0T4H2_9CAUL|nr:hypothetical protein [Caulobacter hibisci]MBI1685732.1 hypothetical protein [Caulobacter hibisci]